MSLPSIKVTLPIILVCWGVGAVLAGLWPLLVYPVMWIGVGGLLFVLHSATASKAEATTDS